MGNRAYSFEEVIEEITTGEISFAHKKTIEVITESLPFSERFDYSIYKSASTVTYKIVQDVIDYFIDNDKKKYRNEFLIVLNKLDLEEKPITKAINCSRWIFANDINFSRSQFSMYASFIEARFLGEVNFDNCKFLDNAYFMNCRFFKYVEFDESQFEKGVDFGESHFFKDINMSQSQFGGNVNFANCRFVGNAYFLLTTFLGFSSFDGSSFDQIVDFTSVEIYEKMYFSEIRFHASAIFACMKLDGEIEFDNFKAIEQLNNSDEKKEKILLDFTNNKFKGKICFIDCDLSKCSFLNSEIGCLDFINPTWAKNEKGKIILYDEILMNQKNNNTNELKKLEGLYRQLKVKFASLKNYRLADVFFYNELNIIEKQQSSIITWEKLYKWTSDFGMSWRRPLLLILGVFVLFTFFTTFKIDSRFPTLEGFIESFWINLNDLFLIKISDDALDKLGNFIIALKVKTALVTGLIIQAGFAIRRKFRT